MFIEYAINTKGRQQLVWSKGLKDLVGVEDKTDDDLVIEQVEDAFDVAGLLPDHWTILNYNEDLGKMLHIAKTEGYDGVAKYFEPYNVPKPLTPDEMIIVTEEDNQRYKSRILEGSQLTKDNIWFGIHGLVDEEKQSVRNTYVYKNTLSKDINEAEYFGKNVAWEECDFN